ncbi:hypothetical protein ACFPRL_29660 [Pseudoclavibacter helvolus]
MWSRDSPTGSGPTCASATPCWARVSWPSSSAASTRRGTSSIAGSKCCTTSDACSRRRSPDRPSGCSSPRKRVKTVLRHRSSCSHRAPGTTQRRRSLRHRRR